MPSISSRTSQRQRRPFVGAGVIRSATRWRRTEVLALTDEEKQRISSRIVVDHATGCWLWNGDPAKYGELSFRGVPTRAHRLMLAIYRGEPIPWDAHVHHECERKGCVNPGHLRVVLPGQHKAIHSASVGRRS